MGDEEKKLNVNAPVFVPRADAPAFVPGAAWGTSSQPKTTGENQSAAPPKPPDLRETSPQASAPPVVEKVPESAPAAKQETPAPAEVNNGMPASTEKEKSDTPEVTDEWENDADTAGDTDSAQLEEDEGARRAKKEKKNAAAAKSKKDYVNVVFIGHVDAGKSTIGGHLMYLTGQVDKRTLEKFEKDAREIGRESWYLSWALDTQAEEREKGKTVQVGRASFETEKKHYTILDAPGHKSFVPNMIGGAAQADLAVLVISARKGEFEAGLERGGQTKEHAMLVKTAGVRHLVVLINKMDDPTVEWAEERYNECKDKLLPTLKKVGFQPGKDLYFMPCSGMTGAFLKDPAPQNICPWYREPCFIDYLDSLPSISRAREGPIRMIISDRYNDMGTVVMGKVESGAITKGQTLMLMPNRTSVQVLQIWSDDEETEEVVPGENVKLKLKGIEEDAVMSGFVLCSPDSPCKFGKVFDAQVRILEHKSIVCPGYSPVLHIHEAVEEVTVKALICLVDMKTGEKIKDEASFR